MNLGFLRGLYGEIGEYVSVYLDTDRTQKNSSDAVDIRWHGARRQLAAAGARPASLDAVAAVDRKSVV